MWSKPTLLTVTTVTAKEAFARATRFTDISISDDIKTYSLDAFLLAMALLEIGKTLEATEEKAKAIDAAN